MTRPVVRATAAALAVVAALGAAACGKGGGGKQGGIKVGPGVTTKAIKLGILTDLSGVFAPLGKPLASATQLYWKQQNARGGVCGRKVEIVVRDHGYNPQKAVTLYRDMEPDIAGLQQLLGSPITVALKPTLDKQHMYVGLAAWTPALVSDPNIQITGTTYDLEMINGIDYLVKKGLLKKGDTVGHLYFEGDYGEGALLGSKYAATKYGLKLLEQKIKATDTDMSGPVSAFKRAGVKAILITVAPEQTAATAGVAKAQGLNVPIMGSGPVWAPQLLGTPAGSALAKPGPIAVKRAWSKTFPKAAANSVSVDFGWATATVMNEVLKKACANKDLTRQGLVNALHQLSGISLGGLVAGPLDYTTKGQPPTRVVYISHVDKSQPGGLRTLTPQGYEASTAKDYKSPAG